MKKLLSVLLSLALILGVLAVGFTAAARDDVLKFREDGTFRIMMINDTQDDQKLNRRTADFIKKACAQEDPDLVVVAGDILSDIWPFCTEEKIDKNINELCSILQGCGVHFALTMGNHDHDRIDECSTVEHVMNITKNYSLHVSTADCFDPATYSIPVYSSDGRSVKYIVYMMDSNNKGQALSMSGYTGLYPEQIEWFKNRQEEYKEANGGEYVPSTVIQHVPVAEIYDLLVKVDMKDYIDYNTVYSTNDHNWYKLNTADYPDMTGTMGEAPCSELVSTGQYQAMVDTGVVSAFFAHDHVNNFCATTKDGIMLGYNGGTGFNSYGVGGERSCRIINVDENNPTAKDTYEIYYTDVTGKWLPSYPTDILSPKIITVLMKILVFIPSLFSKIFNL